jgi:maleate isomerase
MDGWRARIGLIIPSTNAVMEGAFWRLAPPGVSIYTSRILQVETTPESLVESAKHIETAANLLRTAEPDIVVYADTSGTFVGGEEWNQDITNTIESRSEARGLTTSTAVVEALRSLKARSLSVATPYTESINKRLTEYLKSHDFSIESICGMGISRNLDFGQISAQSVYSFAKRSFVRSDALFIPCTNLDTLEILGALQDDLGVPVVTAVTATVKESLRCIGIACDIGYGEKH